MSGNEKVWADGFIAKRKDTSPDFVITEMSIKVSEAIPFLQEHAKNDWVNLSVKRAKLSGKLYVELDTYEPNRGDVNRQGMEQARAAASGGTPGQRKGPDPAQAPVPPPGDYGNFDDDCPF